MNQEQKKQVERIEKHAVGLKRTTFIIAEDKKGVVVKENH
jgi:hypothetical protein